MLILSLRCTNDEICRCLVRQEPLLGQLKRILCDGITMAVELGPVQTFKVVGGIKTYLSLPNTEYVCIRRRMW